MTMRTHKLEITDNGWSGSVTVRVPKVSDRLKMMNDMNLKLNDQGEIDSANLDVLSVIGKMLPLVKGYVEAVELKYNEIDVTDPEDLEYYNEAIPVLSQIGLFLMQGASLSKN